MHQTHAIIQPKTSTLGTLATWARGTPPSQIDIAAAYATVSGVRDLIASMEANAGVAWPKMRKRWLIAFDYLRSEPLALSTLADLKNSTVRIHDADRVLRQKGTPLVPFHPKAFILKGASGTAALAGSGNLSRSGLIKGFEAGFLISVRKPINNSDRDMQKALRLLSDWFTGLWLDAVPLKQVLDEYKGLYESTPKLKQPTPTDDDTISVKAGRNALTGEDLLKLRVCRHFWIQAGKVTRNRGKKLPGNQLMMRRLSRIFFGVPASDVPQNSPLTKLQISYGASVKPDCSLTFSDNGMDKLTLPVPGNQGPPLYDNENLLFVRVGPGKFSLTLGSQKTKAEWKAKSQAIGAFHVMPQGGREWGVF